MLIAEIGMNHLGSKKRLFAMIESLTESKIDALTIQIRENSFYTQKESKLLLDDKTYKEAIKKVKDAGKKIGFAICDEQTLHLAESVGVDFYKIIRDGMNNHKLISKALETNKTIIVSTGLSSTQEIDYFLKKFDNNNIVINHTQLSYEVADCNLKAIQTLKNVLNCKVSFGSHCRNKDVLLMSLCYEPEHLMFYVKTEEDLIFPDHEHAVSIKESQVLIEKIINLSQAIGNGTKIKMCNKME